MQVAIVIPARMGSTRFPGKPLCDLAGKPMVQWVVEAAKRAGVTDTVVVATPDSEIVDACRRFDARAVLTSSLHVSGTDRIAEVAETLHADVYVNVQGDEPLLRADTIRKCVAPLLQESSVKMASVYAPCASDEENDPAVVKVVLSLNGDALYFSRYPVPYARNARTAPLKKHIGTYAYRKEVLLGFAAWAPTELEQTESLEQLRFLEHGVRIRMSPGEGSEMAVDTPEQAEAVRQLLLARPS